MPTIAAGDRVRVVTDVTGVDAGATGTVRAVRDEGPWPIEVTPDDEPPGIVGPWVFAADELELADDYRIVLELGPALSDVVSERAAQDLKWGEQSHDHPTWLAILTEEVGEASEEVLNLRFPDASKRPGEPYETLAALRDELVQVAAVAVAWVENIDRGDPDVRSHRKGRRE